jgi:hypothetical protein
MTFQCWASVPRFLLNSIPHTILGFHNQNFTNVKKEIFTKILQPISESIHSLIVFSLTFFLHIEPFWLLCCGPETLLCYDIVL